MSATSLIGVISGGQKYGGGLSLPAIRFNGTQFLSRGGSLFSTNSKALLVSVWLANQTLEEGFGTLLTTPTSYVMFVSGSPPQCILALYATDYASSINCGLFENTIVVTGTTWTHILYKMNPNASTIADAAQLVLNGVFQPQVGNVPFGHGSLPFATDVTSDTSFFVGTQDGVVPALKCDVSQLYLAYGDAANLDLSDSGNISKFYNNGPVFDLLNSGAPSPLILFDGDASTFAVNQGTVGPLTLTGTLSNVIGPS